MNRLDDKQFNYYLDTLVRPTIQLFKGSWSTFQLCGYIGLGLAVLLVISLTIYRGMSLSLVAIVVLSSVSIFLMLTMGLKILTGKESLVYYNYQIAVIGVTILILWWLSQPILSYLDLTILGLGLCLACTRIGCLMVGCCHGQPAHCGVCYRKEHADAGFTPYFVGVRLFPIQAVESLWTFCIVLVGVFLVLANYPPGEAFSWYITTYGLGRFQFEFWRGDPERFYLCGFSQAQWLSLLSLCTIVSVGWLGILPFHWWQVGIAVWLGLTMIVIALKRRFQGTTEYKILHPYHVREVAEVLERVSNLATEKTNLSDSLPTLGNIPVGCTSLGIQISASKIKQAEKCIYLYALSQHNGTMTEETAKILVDLICQLRRTVNSSELIKGSKGVFHLLLPTPIQRSS